MKKYAFLLITFLGVNAAFAQKPYLTKEFNSADIKRLEVWTSGGKINVIGGTKAVVNVIVNGSGNLSHAEIDEYMMNYNLSVDLVGNTLNCIAKQKDKSNWKNSLSIGFEITIPQQIDANLNTSGGSIFLKNLNGRLNFTTSGGSLELANLEGKIDGTTSGGSINIDGSWGKTDVKTSGGSINLKNINGDIVASTSAGNIIADVKSMGKVVELRTNAGNIHANLPFGSGMDLDIHGYKIKSEKLSKVSKTIGDGVVVGRVNGGGTKVNINAGMGNVFIE